MERTQSPNHPIVYSGRWLAPHGGMFRYLEIGEIYVASMFGIPYKAAMSTRNHTTKREMAMAIKSSIPITRANKRGKPTPKLKRAKYKMVPPSYSTKRKNHSKADVEITLVKVAIALVILGVVSIEVMDLYDITIESQDNTYKVIEIDESK